MSMRDSLLVCLVPYLLAAIVWFGLDSQVISDWQDKDKQIADKAQQQLQLKVKLVRLAKLQKEKQDLESDIASLRNAVPKDANLELLMIDLEKMCLSSRMDLVSIERADEKKIAELAAEPGGSHDLSSYVDGSSTPKNKDQLTSVTTALPAKGKKTKPGLKGKQSLEEEAGLSTVVLDVSVAGEYSSLIKLMQTLEAYQRITGVNHLSIGAPETSDKDKHTTNNIKASFFLTAYYLP